jgi:hypothetical protein
MIYSLFLKDLLSLSYYMCTFASVFFWMYKSSMCNVGWFCVHVSFYYDAFCLLILTTLKIRTNAPNESILTFFIF